MRPRIFVGSSTESLPLALKLQQGLNDHATVVLWNQGVFNPSEYILERLIELTGEFDFAVFIVSPDDTVEFRGERVLAARDNVLFEAGLFFSRLGRSRTFLVMPTTERGKAPIHIPSDLAGLTMIPFRHPASKQDLPAAIGPVCTAISDALENQKCRAEKVLSSLSGGPIFLLRHIAKRSYNLGELGAVLSYFNNADQAAQVPWEKAAKYALQLLKVLKLAKDHGGDEYHASPDGKRLLDNEAAKEQFPREFSMPLVADSTLQPGKRPSNGEAEDAAMKAMPVHIQNYLKRNRIQAVSFDRVRKNINPAYTDAQLQVLIDTHPSVFRRVRMKDGRAGIGSVQ